MKIRSFPALAQTLHPPDRLRARTHVLVHVQVLEDVQLQMALCVQVQDQGLEEEKITDQAVSHSALTQTLHPPNRLRARSLTGVTGGPGTVVPLPPPSVDHAGGTARDRVALNVLKLKGMKVIVTVKV